MEDQARAVQGPSAPECLICKQKVESPGTHYNIHMNEINMERIERKRNLERLKHEDRRAENEDRRAENEEKKNQRRRIKNKRRRIKRKNELETKRLETLDNKQQLAMEALWQVQNRGEVENAADGA
ncbi:hypothetical protein QE152_g19197 [Popillia japonica]|uniref:BZIP domain-containing protein n=1 Tax=Popillia japonica TaxID=7064 RepID=A0AAW1L2S1_POPJA